MEQFGFHILVMRPNDEDGMTYCIDPDQTAPMGAVLSGSALFVQPQHLEFYDTCHPKSYGIARVPCKVISSFVFRVQGTYGQTRLSPMTIFYY